MIKLLADLAVALQLLSVSLAAQVPVTAEIQTNEVFEIRLSVEQIITEEATAHNIDVPFALYLARNESNFNPLAKNPNSSATGVYQFITRTWMSLCEGNREDARDNTRCAMKIISKGGISHWCADPSMKNKLNKQYPETCKSSPK